MAIWHKYNWDFWNPETEPMPLQVKEHRKISFCTTCMDRAYDLKVTLPKNIQDNIDYPNIEFVILNYNSKDDLDDWIKKEMMQYIEAGILNYYKTTEPKYYSMSHSRNVAFKVAQGEIVNNIDADNFTNKGFAFALNKLAELQNKKAVFCRSKRMMHGRFGMYKNEFLEIGGYDEGLTGYGFDDKDILYRAMALKCKMMWFTGINIEFSERIKTPRRIVGQNMEDQNWKKTEKLNQEISLNNLKNKKYIANTNQHWGKAELMKNFEKDMKI